MTVILPSQLSKAINVKYRKKKAKDMVFYVCVGLEMYNIFLNFKIPYIRKSVLFILLKVVSGVNNYNK